jgi:hypothetical protein
MSDWAVGDLAVCVGPLDADDDERGMFKGRIYTVSAYFITPGGLDGLLFKEGIDPSPWHAWNPDCFRKILPDKHEACESEFVDLLKRINRPVSA